MPESAGHRSLVEAESGGFSGGEPARPRRSGGRSRDGDVLDGVGRGQGAWARMSVQLPRPGRSQMFGKRRRARSQPYEVYLGLRQQILTLDPAAAAIAATA